MTSYNTHSVPREIKQEVKVLVTKGRISMSTLCHPSACHVTANKYTRMYGQLKLCLQRSDAVGSVAGRASGL